MLKDGGLRLTNIYMSYNCNVQLIQTTNHMLFQLANYIKYFYVQVLGQVKTWLTSMTVQKLVVVIKGVDTNEVLERWQFDVQCDKSHATSQEG